MGEWYAIAAVRYVLVLGVGHVVACAVDPAPGLPFWRAFGEQLHEWADLTVALGMLGLFLLLLLGLTKRYGSTAVFRAWAAVLLFFPLVPLWLGGIGGYIGVLLLTQLAFAVWFMPRPALRPLV